jgi:phenylalanyl-tRNA synthetase beta chain
MTADQEYLRTSLRGNLLTALATNRRHEDGVIMLFELGKVYLPRDNNLPDEPEMLCALLSGSGMEKSWHGQKGLLDFFDAKGVVESLLAKLGIKASFEESGDDSFCPGKQVAIAVGGTKLGVIGQLHPKVAESFDISGEVFLFEIDLAALLPHTLGYKPFQPIPRFPAVVRDIALVVDAAISHQRVTDIIRGFPLVKKVTLFDIYSGKQVPPDKKSLAYRISFQSAEHTLTDEEADKVQQQIISKLSGELGATLRA